MLPTDPQVQAAAIQTIGGALFGASGTGVFSWFRKRRQNSQDARCERICTNMMAAMEAMLAALAATGGNKPELTDAIVKVRVQLDHARQYLDGDAE